MNVPGDPVEESAERISRRPWPMQRLRPGIEVSFEFFPANTAQGVDKLAECATQLSALEPKFVSVTYGAGGSTQDRTHAAIERLLDDTDVPVAGHLTCVGATRDETHAVIDQYLSAGVRHIVALRGDAHEGHTDGTVANGYANAGDLVAGIRHHLDQSDHGRVEISVGAYPEVHPRAESSEADLDNLKRKLDAGADRAITQFFFDPDIFLRFLDRARSAGITAPIVPGIMPINSFEGIVRFAGRCGAEIPVWMHDLFGGLDEAPEVRQLVAATVAAEQCRRLAEHGISDFHFYTMNRPELTTATCRILGITPQTASAGKKQLAS